jgi:hypothetical protein
VALSRWQRYETRPGIVIDAFLARYTPDAVVEDATGAVVMRGRNAMRAAYSEFRASPDLRVEIATRIRAGEYMIDEGPSQEGEEPQR